MDNVLTHYFYPLAPPTIRVLVLAFFRPLFLQRKLIEVLSGAIGDGLLVAPVKLEVAHLVCIYSEKYSNRIYN